MQVGRCAKGVFGEGKNIMLTVGTRTCDKVSIRRLTVISVGPI